MGGIGHMSREIRGLAASVAALLVAVTAAASGAQAAPASGVHHAAQAVAAPAPGTFTGKGFDTCAAPSNEAMQAWLASPYRAVGIYFGGPNRACAQPNLTASWVTTQQQAGWHLIPIYLGLQAPCTTSNKRFLIEPTQAAAQGRSSADDAVSQARAIGLPPESVLILDMEAYRTGDATCRAAVLTYQSAFTARLHDHGYFSGFYSSMASGVADQVAVYQSTAYVRPDYLDFARWDGVATVSDPAIPGGYWSPHRRIKQYQGGHTETWGGVTINIDNDYLDVAPLPATPFGDFSGNGWPDLLSRQLSSGNLFLYPGNGTSFGARTTIGYGWNTVNEITRLGDFNRDGREDVFARENVSGDLYLYPGTGGVLTSRARIAAGWGGMREITAVGDYDRDGFPDVAAVETATGILYLYPGRGDSLGARVNLGYGWNTVDEVTGAGDLTGDGTVDVLAREKATGNLFLYPGSTGAFPSRTKVGAGWNSMRGLVGSGDFRRDGRPDLIAIETATADLYLYSWTGSGFAARLRIGTGWGGMQPIL